MSHGWTLYEAYAGSAAWSWHYLGGKRAIVPYQGSKWAFRRDLSALAAQQGFKGPPSQIIVADTGPWGTAFPELVEAGGIGSRGSVIAHLKAMQRCDPREGYERLQGQPVSDDEDDRYTAEFLFLQRLAFSGKAVREVNGKWVSPGFNATSAYGKPATGSFGAIRPQIPSLILSLEMLDLQPIPVRVVDRASALGPWGVPCPERTLVYLDPPYQGTTGYGPETDDPCRIAKEWAKAGATVMYSEARPMVEELGSNWRLYGLSYTRNGNSPFKRKHREWVTYV